MPRLRLAHRCGHRAGQQPGGGTPEQHDGEDDERADADQRLRPGPLRPHNDRGRRIAAGWGQRLGHRVDRAVTDGGERELAEGGLRGVEVVRPRTHGCEHVPVGGTQGGVSHHSQLFQQGLVRPSRRDHPSEPPLRPVGEAAPHLVGGQQDTRRHPLGEGGVHQRLDVEGRLRGELRRSGHGAQHLAVGVHQQDRVRPLAGLDSRGEPLLSGSGARPQRGKMVDHQCDGQVDGEIPSARSRGVQQRQRSPGDRPELARCPRLHPRVDLRLQHHARDQHRHRGDQHEERHQTRTQAGAGAPGSAVPHAAPSSPVSGRRAARRFQAV